MPVVVTLWLSSVGVHSTNRCPAALACPPAELAGVWVADQSADAPCDHPRVATAQQPQEFLGWAKVGAGAAVKGVQMGDVGVRHPGSVHSVQAVRVAAGLAPLPPCSAQAVPVLVGGKALGHRQSLGGAPETVLAQPQRRALALRQAHQQAVGLLQADPLRSMDSE